MNIGTIIGSIVGSGILDSQNNGSFNKTHPLNNDTFEKNIDIVKYLETRIQNLTCIVEMMNKKDSKIIKKQIREYKNSLNKL